MTEATMYSLLGARTRLRGVRTAPWHSPRVSTRSFEPVGPITRRSSFGVASTAMTWPGRRSLLTTWSMPGRATGCSSIASALARSWSCSSPTGPASAGLAVLHVSPGSLELEQVLSLDHSEFPAGVQQPRFTDAAGNEIAATADIPPANGRAGVSFLLQCDRIARACDRGAPAPAKEWLRQVDESATSGEGG